MNRSCALQIFAVIALGLFSGAMVLISLVLVPYWISISIELYRQNFRDLAPYLGNTMIPLLISAVVLSGFCAAFVRGNRKPWIVAFCLILVIIPLYKIIHAPVNALLLGEEKLSPEILETFRTQWIVWHAIRTVCGVAAFFIAVAGILKNKASSPYSPGPV